MRGIGEISFPSRRNMFLVGGGVLFTGLTIRGWPNCSFSVRPNSRPRRAKCRIRLEPAPPHRGTIYDRTGRVLAGSKRNFYVTLRPELAGDRDEIIDVIDRLSRLVRLTEAKKRTVIQEATTGPRTATSSSPTI
jgi:penicillin-binding protein 2